MITLRPWRNDEAAVGTLLTAIWGTNDLPRYFARLHGVDRDDPKSFRRTLCAIDDSGGAVGVGTLWQNSLHPGCWQIAIHVAAECRRQGIGSQLLSALDQMQPTPQALKSGTIETDLASCAFLRSNGFVPDLRSRHGVFAPEVVPIDLLQEMDEGERRVLSAGIQIRTLPEAVAFGTVPRDIARVHVEVYWMAHVWDAPRPVSESEADEIFLSPEDVLPESMFLALDGDRPIAVASLRRGSALDDIYLGYVGAGVGAGDLSEDLARALLGRCIGQAKAKGWHLRFEADDRDSCWWDTMNRIPAELEADWLTFLRQAAAERSTSHGPIRE